MGKSERLQAIVLRRTDYSEADRVLQVLTPKGRRSIMAKGVRRERSKLAGGIELFALCDIVIRSGRGELSLLTSARLSVFYRHILEDYERMQFAYMALKLVAKASELIDEPEWFSVLRQTLEHLDRLEIDRRLIEAWFYIQYAGLLGEELNVRTDTSGQPLSPDKRYVYDLTERSLRPSKQGDIAAEHIKLLRLIQVNSLKNIAQVSGVDAVIGGCWLVSRQCAAV